MEQEVFWSGLVFGSRGRSGKNRIMTGLYIHAKTASGQARATRRGAVFAIINRVAPYIIMVQCIFVGLGGFAGAVARYLLGAAFSAYTAVFPLGTLLINFAGSFLIGLIAEYSAGYAALDKNLYLFLTVGLCGGFTTFSTFSLETFGLVSSGRAAAGAAYAAASVLLCLAGVFLGKGAARLA